MRIDLQSLKSLILLVLLLLSVEQQCLATVTATTVWEVMQDAGNADNGACFDGSVAVPGTDYSQQAASQYNAADLVIDGADDTLITSASHNFVAADEGNCIRVSPGTGFTAGWYVITDTSANAATLSSAVGTVGSTGGTYRVGGAALLNSTNADDYFEAAVAGNTYWIKYNASSHVLGEAVSVTADANSTTGVMIAGYNTTRGDNPAGATRPTIDQGVNGFVLAGDYFSVSNLIHTGTAVAVLQMGTGGQVTNVKVTNTSVSARIALSLNGISSTVTKSELISTNGAALSLAIGNQSVIGNSIHDSVTCIQTSTTDNHRFLFNLFRNCTTSGMLLGSGSDWLLIMYNTFVGAAAPAGTGINGSAAVQSINTTIYGNIFWGWTTAVNMNANVDSIFSDYNDFYNNTTDRTNVDTGVNDLALDPQFTDVSGGDFSIGANLKAAGFPGTFPGSSTTGYLDMGAVQRQEPAAAGGQKAYGFVQ